MVLFLEAAMLLGDPQPNWSSQSKERWLGDSNELKAIQRVWELRVAFVHRNEQQNHHHQQQQQPEQLLSFGRVTFLHLHKMTMLIAGLFNLGLWMFPSWPACDTHVTAFQSCQSLKIFMTLAEDTKGSKGFQHQKRVLKLLGSPRNAPKPALECPTSFVPKGTQANLVRLMPKATKTTKKHRFLSGSKHFPLILFRLTYDIMDFGPSTCEPTNRWKLDEN